MGHRILSHPFRLTPAGVVATVAQDSADGHAEQVGVIALTRLGERPLAPSFGIPDPSWTGGTIEVGDIAAVVDEHGPPVELGDVSTVATDDGAHLVTLEFDF